jgi:hypothetical protein
MARSHEERAEEQREKAAEYDAVADALEQLRDELLEADSIGETRLSELCHEARTNRPDTWNSATAFVDVDEGEAVVDSVSKLREGSWSPETRDRYDALVSVGVRPFMETSMFRSWAGDDLRQAIQGARQNAQQARRAADDIERLAERSA